MSICCVDSIARELHSILIWAILCVFYDKRAGQSTLLALLKNCRPNLVEVKNGLPHCVRRSFQMWLKLFALSQVLVQRSLPALLCSPLIKIMLFPSTHMFGRYAISHFCINVVTIASTSVVSFGHTIVGSLIFLVRVELVWIMSITIILC